MNQAELKETKDLILSNIAMSAVRELENQEPSWYKDCKMEITLSNGCKKEVALVTITLMDGDTILDILEVEVEADSATTLAEEVQFDFETACSKAEATIQEALNSITKENIMSQAQVTTKDIYTTTYEDIKANPQASNTEVKAAEPGIMAKAGKFVADHKVAIGVVAAVAIAAGGAYYYKKQGGKFPWESAPVQAMPSAEGLVL